jgi:UDP-glucose 4,6-dehydratase
MPTIITRGNNVYGPHQYPEKLIPKFIYQLMRGNKVTLHGTGENTRNFLYVEDVARAFEVILFKGVTGNIYNIGGTNERQNIEVARDLIRSLGYTNPDEMMQFVSDRAFNGLAATVKWYQSHTSRYGNIDSALVAHPREGLNRGLMG